MTYQQLRDLIDAQPMRASQWLVIGVCFLLNMLDGMDVLVMSYAAPLIMSEWSVEPSRFGLVFSAALVGMALGAIFLSPRADVIGRRRMVLLGTIWIAAGMLLTAQAQSLHSLMLLRGFTGLGIGAMLATLTSVAAEYASAERRNLVVGLVLSGYPVGATAAGFLVAPILGELGWRWLFMAAGSISALMIPVIFILMPESLAFILRRQPPGALHQVNYLLGQRRLEPLVRLPEIPPERRLATSVRTLFDKTHRTDTLWLWTAFFLSFLSMYFLLSWVPKLVVNAGLGLDRAIYAGALFNLGAFFGITGLGHFSNRFGLRRLIILFFILTALLLLTFGWMNVGVEVMLVETFLLGLFMQGGFVGLYAVAARLYAVDIRTTGVGWAIGAGRTGAIVGPYVGGLTISMGWGMTANFVVFALPCLLAAAATACLRSREIDPR